jgi:Flp pilus assembly CpaF family ATPase
MRIEFVNKITQKSGLKELPPRLNPVRIGHHPDNHLVLDSPYVGGEAVVLENDVAGGNGWRVWNRNGKAVKVGEQVLTERDQFVPIRTPRLAVECWPYVLTVLFAADELATETDDARRLDRACAELVREVHRAVVELHPNDPADRAEWLKDGYVHQLEKEIAELSGGRPDFPGDDLAQTELGNHLAGVAVRSALLNKLVARSEANKPTADNSTWARPRIVLPDLEAELDRLVDAAHGSLHVAAETDLTAQVRQVDAKFWPFWYDLLGRKGALTSRVCRYLALRRLTKEIKDIWFGYGPLEDLLDDPNISEIMVVDSDHIFIEKRGVIEDSGRRFLTPPLTIVQRIMAKANRQVNTAQPLADARMPDGSRVNAVIEPLALKGPALTIRKFPAEKLTIDRLVNEYRALTPAARDFLRAAVVNKCNIIVAGGTGSGKTTMLNCLSEFIPDKERIVTIEDTAELQLKKTHVVTLQGRQSNQEGAGSVTIRDLVKNSLRMRPDRIVVGECRGGEAIDMLQAMNTGHDGSMTTLHANTPTGVVRRLEVLVQQNADSTLPVESIHAQIGTAVHLIVQLAKLTIRGKSRKVLTEITEVLGHEAGEGVRLKPLFERGVDGELRPTGHLPTFLPELIEAGLVKDAVEFVRAVES